MGRTVCTGIQRNSQLAPRRGSTSDQRLTSQLYFEPEFCHSTEMTEEQSSLTNRKEFPMYRYVNIISLLVFGLFVVNISTAGDLEDVKKATIAHIAAQNAGDAKTHIDGHTAYHTFFGPGGGLLDVTQTREEQIRALQTTLDAGVKFNLKIAHLEAKVYGNAAVVTGYVVGTVTSPDGSIQQSRGRRSAVLIKQGNEWKEVHAHISPVRGAGN